MTWVNPEHPEPEDEQLRPDPELHPVEPEQTDAPGTPAPAARHVGVVDEDGGLIIDEPPVDPLADTNPSLAVRPEDFPPPDDPLTTEDIAAEVPMWRRVVGLAMLLLALALVMIAVLVGGTRLLSQQEEPTPAVVAQALPTDTPAPQLQTGEGEPLLVVEPTLSPEQIAALLATPPSDDAPPGVAIQRSDSPFTIIPDRPRAEVTSYTIQDGDTVSTIADTFGLDKDTIAWSNDRQVVFALRPGNELFIMPVDGVYHHVLVDQSIQSIADEYSVDPYDIINSQYNDLFGATPASLIPSGTYVVVPGGTGSYNDWTYNPVVERSSGGGGGAASAGYISFARGEPGSCGSQPNPGGTGYFVRPLQSYTWVRGFTGYHSGVDLAGGVGTPVYAASQGRVIYAGWNNWGYGYLVVLAHGPFTTFYAHLSSINVGCGQMIGAGQVVGGMGSTGNSSGPHLHFEIRYNDTPTDPLLYLGF